MWQFFSIMLTIAWPATFNVVSFSLLLVQYPKVDTSSLFYFGVCDNFSPSSLLGANTYTSNVAIFSPLSWLEHRQKHLMWSVFLYSWCNTQRWTLLLYSTLVYVTAFLHLHYLEPPLYTHVAVFSPLSWLEHGQKYLMWSVFLYS